MGELVRVQFFFPEYLTGKIQTFPRQHSDRLDKAQRFIGRKEFQECLENTCYHMMAHHLSAPLFFRSQTGQKCHIRFKLQISGRTRLHQSRETANRKNIRGSSGSQTTQRPFVCVGQAGGRPRTSLRLNMDRLWTRLVPLFTGTPSI